MNAPVPEVPASEPQNSRPRKRTRRWFLRSLLGVGVLAAAGKGVDYLLPRTICRPGEWHGPRTDHFDGMYFHNVAEPAPPADYGSAPILRWLKDRLHRGEYPDIERNAHTPQLAERVTGRDWEVTMINHSTMLVRLEDYTILTDPVWSDYTSPIQGIGPRRTRPPGIAWENLPHIDICLLSHDHYDHFDAHTLRLLEERDHPLFILPLGLRSLLEYHTNNGVRVEEKDWWESVELPRLTVHLTPARHWSKRYRTAETANRSLWCGFYLVGHGGVRLLLCRRHGPHTLVCPHPGALGGAGCSPAARRCLQAGLDSSAPHRTGGCGGCPAGFARETGHRVPFRHLATRE